MNTGHKPCPFCGYGEINQGCCELDTAQGSKWGGVSCPACEARGPLVRTDYTPNGRWVHDALDEWDKRGGGQ